MASDGLSEFKEVLADFRDLHSIALKAAIAVPLADAWLKLGPPPSKLVGALTSLMEFIVVVWVFQFWSDVQDRGLRIRMKIALALFLISIVSALLLLQRFTVSPGQGRERVIEGLYLRPDVKSLVDTSYTPEEALRDSEYDPDQVWTRESIVLLRTLITVTWIASFVFLAIYLNVFIILQRRRHSLR